jgi:hypothetical protein
MTHADRHDANQAEIVAALRSMGATYVQQDRNAGFDILVLYRGRMHLVEIKSGKRWKLTPNELRMQGDAWGQCIPYNVITTPDEMIQLLQEDV